MTNQARLIYQLRSFAKCYSDPIAQLLTDSADSLYDNELTPFQKVVFEAVQLTNKETSDSISDILNMQVTQASNMLKDLHDMGFLGRLEAPKKSGGYKFVYSVKVY